MGKKCTKNMICFPMVWVSILVIFAIISIVIVPYLRYKREHKNISNSTHIHNLSPTNTTQNPFNNILSPPLKPSWMPSIQVPPLNIPTNQRRAAYAQVGILTRIDDTIDQSQERETILALFGRPLHNSRSKWQYYTMTDKNRGIKLPVTIKGKSGNDTYGVDELFSGDSIHVKGFDKKFYVTMYETETIEYI